ncbi:MAG: patatin-like phospholipase family protein [Segetibacter sp.]|nr:patatin-like phospholipase family protein [Segetibacter sp.]
MPTETSTPGDTFYIGLCMAGAVSAGAYTAGVMDYLMEALEEWQKRKDAKTEGTPTHNVVIPVIGGASAGGMTGIITAAALNNPIVPVTKPSDDLLAEHPESKLYHSWVDLLSKDMFPLLLKTDDIKDKQIISLLNSDFLDCIAEKAIKADKKAWKDIPPYFDKELQIFTTLTNLQGFQYNVGLNAGSTSEKYYMAIHNDYACFKLNSSSETADGWMLLDFKNDINTDIARNAAMATGAFPVGLKSRLLKRKSSDVNLIPWCIDITKQFPVPGEECETLNVDGGVINNEPFEKVRDVLMKRTGQDVSDDYQDYKKFKSTVLMIDPFPSTKPAEFKPDQKLFQVIGLTLGAILEQMRSKPVDLDNAMNPVRAGQFLIAPSRKRQKIDGEMEEVAGDKAIACGAFSGFAGFISKEFRVHDYFLGRFNCETFLRDYFTIPAEDAEINEIFKNGYAGTDKKKFTAKDGKIQIIPIFSPRPPENYFPIPTFSGGGTWPTIKARKIDELRRPVKKRVQALIMNAVKVNWYKRILLWAGAKILLNGVLTTSAMSTIKEALRKHELLKTRK